MDLKKIRKENQKKTLALLKKGGSSCKELAEAVGVSNVAMYNILEDFAAKGIISSSTVSAAALGRKPATYFLNENYGVFVALDFTPPKLKICLHSILGEVLAYEEVPFAAPVRAADIDEYIDRIKKLLKRPAAQHLPLKNICVSTPGRIDPETGYFTLAAIYEDFRNLSLKKVFEEAFGCPALVKNNVGLALIGEINKYELTDKNILYLYIDESIGGALCFNGQIRNGDNFLSGEIAFSTSFDGQPISKFLLPKNASYLYKTLVLNEVRMPEKELEKRLNHTIDDVFRLYNEGDRYAVRALSKTASVLAILINNFESLVDCNCVIIHSYLSNCGEVFRKHTENEIRALCDPPGRKILFTDPDNRIFIDGCINYSIDKNIISTLQLD